MSTVDITRLEQHLVEVFTLTPTLTEALLPSLAEPWRLSPSTLPPTVEASEEDSEELPMEAASVSLLHLTSLRQVVGAEHEAVLEEDEEDSQQRVEEVLVLRLLRVRLLAINRCLERRLCKSISEL